MKRVIKGFEKFKSRKGTDCCAIFVETEFMPRDGVEQKGVKYETVMCYGDAGVITDKAIGHELVGFFGYNNGTCTVQTPSVV